MFSVLCWAFLYPTLVIVALSARTSSTLLYFNGILCIACRDYPSTFTFIWTGLLYTYSLVDILLCRTSTNRTTRMAAIESFRAIINNRKRQI